MDQSPDIFPRCSVEGCGKLRWCKGVCTTHYFRLRTHGTAEGSGLPAVARRASHGLAGHPLYATWNAMVDRCTDPGHPNWPNYGGRGIAVCERWRGDVAAFVADVAALSDPPWAPGLSLDRKDNDGDYRPGNVRWATRKQQAANQRRSLLVATIGPGVLAMRGRGATQTAIAAEFGVSPETVRRILSESGAPKVRTRTAPEEERRIMALRRAGMTPREIAGEAGRSEATVRRVLRAAGLVRPRRSREEVAVSRRRAAALHAEGRTVREIAAEVGRSGRYTYTLLRDAGVALKPRRPRPGG